MSIGFDNTMRLASEMPSYKNPYGGNTSWLVVVNECYKLSRNTPDFAGAWISDVGWFPSLKTLVKYGILRKTETSRGGRRAYYVMQDRDGVGKALKELGILNIRPE